jgi:FkbM family methyltransferase|tara:strand:+ start:665 stop:1534 length:870 start_codon:yes stop_codon:yes gene_type:complete
MILINHRANSTKKIKNTSFDFGVERMSQKNLILNILEKICRSNLYLFLISRYLTGKLFSKIIYDNDFNIIKNLEKNNYFDNKNVVIDIGANDGMSYQTIRRFTKKPKIISFEPIDDNFRILKKFKKEDKLFNCLKIALSNKSAKEFIFIPCFRKFSITLAAGINKMQVINRLKISLPIKNIINKIHFKKSIIKTKKLDNFKLKPSLIKIDIEGHEFEGVCGAIKTISKYKPILMVEYDKRICDKIFKILKKFNYDKFMYNKTSKKIEKFKNQKVLNIFYITKEKIKFFN